MDCLKEAGRPAEEVSLSVDALDECEEIFLTNSLAEITPVGEIEGRHSRSRKKTREVMALFSEYCSKRQYRGS